MYHHFKGNRLSRSEKIERLVVNRILESPIPDKPREESKIFELKHINSCIQITRLLAIKRGLDRDLATVIAALHDLSVIDTGSYKEHAHRSAELAKPLLSDFTEDEQKTIINAIYNHSDKQVYSKDQYTELIKDADTLDCCLYDDTVYSAEKPPEIAKEYMNRYKKVKQELGLK
ncbi:MAG: HD domain-containing protein [archaeon]